MDEELPEEDHKVAVALLAANPTYFFLVVHFVQAGDAPERIVRVFADAQDEDGLPRTTGLLNIVAATARYVQKMRAEVAAIADKHDTEEGT